MMQGAFFERATPTIPGLTYIPDFISPAQEIRLLDYIDQNPWLNDLKRRVQHYGYRYDYKARRVTEDSYIGPLPDWLTPVTQALSVQRIFNAKPDQAIVNEYKPGQGIADHIDCVPCFGETIASLSLGSAVMMRFTRDADREDMILEPRSLLIMSGPARYDWQHGIPARKSDVIDGIKVPRTRRVSVTFRQVVL